MFKFLFLSLVNANRIIFVRKSVVFKSIQLYRLSFQFFFSLNFVNKSIFFCDHKLSTLSQFDGYFKINQKVGTHLTSKNFLIDAKIVFHLRTYM